MIYLSKDCTFLLVLGGVVLQWFMSYLENRFQSVLIDQTKSNATQLKYGVPQGSVLGPILFTSYTLPLSDLIEMFDCDYHKFADDTQLSKSAHLNNFPMLVKDIEACIGLTWNYTLFEPLVEY